MTPTGSAHPFLKHLGRTWKHKPLAHLRFYPWTYKTNLSSHNIRIKHQEDIYFFAVNNWWN